MEAQRGSVDHHTESNDVVGRPLDVILSISRRGSLLDEFKAALSYDRCLDAAKRLIHQRLALSPETRRVRLQ